MLFAIAEAVLKRARECGNVSIACAESCTGGKIADALTSVPGASVIFRGGLVAYSPEVKKRVLGVPEKTLAEFGVVSRECAEAMALGAAKTLGADWSVATTGVAGPGPQDGIPAGTVCIAVFTPGGVFSGKYVFPDVSRESVKQLAAQAALKLLFEQLNVKPN